MTQPSIGQVSASGMDFERSRVELAMLRLSLIDISFSSPENAKNYAASMESKFAQALHFSPEDQKILPTKQVKDPTNPNADIDGYVYYLNVDPTREMATLVAATRAYEANVKAYNVNAQMTRNALELGNRQ